MNGFAPKSTSTFLMPPPVSSRTRSLTSLLVCASICSLSVPLFIALARYVQANNIVYALRPERLKIVEGVFNRDCDTLELYRVKGIETPQPFVYRRFGVENVELQPSDPSSP